MIAAITFVLLFLLTGSVILPLKALVLNVLSLTAAFGALVWIFQEGHLGALGTTPTGTLVANMPVLLFCIAFGLSMDYEVFLVSRIREYWLSLPGKTRADNDESRRPWPGPHRPRRDRRRGGHVDLVRRADRSPGGVHADVRRRSDAGDPRRRHPGAHAAGACVHARAGPLELVGAETAGPAARTDRHQRVDRRPDPAGGETRTGGGLGDGNWLTMSLQPLKRRRAPRGSGEQLRDEILDATTELLLETGHAKAVSIRSVAQRVGVTPPSIYLHFADKDALLDAVCARYFEKLDEEMQRVASRSAVDRRGAARPGPGLCPIRHADPGAVPHRHDG